MNEYVNDISQEGEISKKWYVSVTAFLSWSQFIHPKKVLCNFKEKSIKISFFEDIVFNPRIRGCSIVLLLGKAYKSKTSEAILTMDKKVTKRKRETKGL